MNTAACWRGWKLAAVCALVPAALALCDEEWARAAQLEAVDPTGAARLVSDALRKSDAVPSAAQQGLAFRLGSTLAERGELQLAAELQVLLHEDVAADWSAVNAAITLGRIGRGEDADELLAAQELRSQDRAELANHRGLLAQGRGDSTAARRHFGRALVAGSRNAGLSLARMDLDAGDLEQARIGFRPGVDDPVPHDWALRGWAFTLLP